MFSSCSGTCQVSEVLIFFSSAIALLVFCLHYFTYFPYITLYTAIAFFAVSAFKYNVLKTTTQIHIHMMFYFQYFPVFLFFFFFQLQLLWLLNMCTISNHNVMLVYVVVIPLNFLIFFMFSAKIQA